METNWFEYDRPGQRIAIHTQGQILIVNKDVLSISYFSEGHGGQNLNKHMNGVRLIYNIPDLHLNTFQKTRQIVTRSINQRNREQNLQQAFDQLAQKLHDYFYVPPHRAATKVPRSSKRQRLQSKSRRSQIKHDRGKVNYQQE